jgi:hypothetical protein
MVIVVGGQLRFTPASEARWRAVAGNDRASLDMRQASLDMRQD